MISDFLFDNLATLQDQLLIATIVTNTKTPTLLKKKRPYKNIVDLKLEMEKILIDFQFIDSNMIAIGIDYKYYLDSNFSDNKIYALRDNILYRLNATKLHINILINLINSLNQELSIIYSQENLGINIHSHFEQRRLDISALFDSVVFHIISTFDYVSNLVVFLSLKGDNKFKWTQLARSVRGKSELSNLNFSDLINELDRTFVGRLYDHRSDIIHFRNDIGKSSLSIELIKGKVETKIISSLSFNRNFKELKDLAKENDLSISFVLLWLLKKTTDSIIDIQFSLKKYMEQNKKIENPPMFIKGPNNEPLPASKNYWKRKNS